MSGNLFIAVTIRTLTSGSISRSTGVGVSVSSEEISQNTPQLFNDVAQIEQLMSFV